MKPLLEELLERVPTDIFTDTTLRSLLKASPDSRYGRVKRAIAAGDLVRLKRGLYVLAKKYQRKTISLFELAQMIYGPSYISLESALSYHGWIPEAVYTITSACAKRSKEFHTPMGVFSFIHIPSNRFAAGVERVDLANNIFLIATPWRALTDYVYDHKVNWTSLEPLRESLRIDESHFQDVDFRLLDALFAATRSWRVRKFINGIKKELLQ